MSRLRAAKFIFQMYNENFAQQLELKIESDGIFVEIPMPKIIEVRAHSKEDLTAGYYDWQKIQRYDTLIAVETAIFNYKKINNNLDPIFTSGGNEISSEFYNQIDLLDPTWVKSIAIQESHGGHDDDITDILTVNHAGDESIMKEKQQLSSSEKISPQKSISSGIQILAGRGFNNEVLSWYPDEEIKSTWTSWKEATQRYGPGKKSPHYSDYIVEQLENARQATKDDYIP